MDKVLQQSLDIDEGSSLSSALDGEEFLENKTLNISCCGKKLLSININEFVKINKILILSLMLCFYNTAQAKDEVVKENIQKPDTKQIANSDKKSNRFSFGLRLGYVEKDKFVFDTPGAHSILSWRGMEGPSIGADIGLKITDRIDTLFEYTYSKIKGDGTDDDIQNSFGAYSAQKARGHVNDYSLVVNFDAYKTESFKFSPRIGYFYKIMKLGMYNGSYDYGDLGAGSIDKALGQLTNSKYHGAKVGFKLEKSFTATTNDVFIFDYYPLVQYYGNQFWPRREPADQHWELRSVNGKGSFSRNMGLMTRLEHIIKINDSISTKIYGFYEYIRASKLEEISRGYVFSTKNGNAEVDGYANWHSFGVGIGFNF